MAAPAASAERLNWQPPDHTVAVDLPDCDARDAVLIDSPAKLGLLSDRRFRIFCLAPGDYRSAGVQEITAVSGRAMAPRVIRLLGDELSPAAVAQAPLSQLAMLPPLYFRDTRHWVLDSLAFIDIDTPAGTFPLRFFASRDIVMNRLRVQGNRHGIEFHHKSRDITLQNSLIGDMDIDQDKGNDAVCVAFEGRYTDRGKDVEPSIIHNVRVVANEIYNCNDGVQLIWNHDARHWPDFAGTLIAANDIYIDKRRLTNCAGGLDEKGECACTENAIDLKAGSYSTTEPVVVRHNRFYGWRRTDSKCNPDANSWGTAISVHFKAAQNIRIEQNLFWDVVSGVSIVRDAKDIAIVDNLFHTVPKAGTGNGIAIVSYDTVKDVEISRNRVVQAHRWLSVLSKNTTLSCNIVSLSGQAMGKLGAGAAIDRNSYYEQPKPLFKSTGDKMAEHHLAAKDTELCTLIQPLSGSSQLCLPHAASTVQSEHACGGGYWRSD
ncbi:MAG: hypothetical protein ACPGSC_03650 [Granulosicoccaceae bacterium]